MIVRWARGGADGSVGAFAWILVELLPVERKSSYPKRAGRPLDFRSPAQNVQKCHHKTDEAKPIASIMLAR